MFISPVLSFSVFIVHGLYELCMNKKSFFLQEAFLKRDSFISLYFCAGDFLCVIDAYF